jgi:hypothetical protein
VDRAQRIFTGPDSRIQPVRSGAVIEGYNGQIAVDGAHQIIVAHRLQTSLAQIREGQMARITEAEIADIVVEILEDRPIGQASIGELVAEIPHRVALSADDLMPSPTRPNEAIWEQQVRNITSHRNSPGNAIYEGRLVAIPGGLGLPPPRIVAD